MSTMNMPYVGDIGSVSYSNQLVSTDSLTPNILAVNQPIPDGMYYTFSTGRFATRRFWRSKYFYPVDKIPGTSTEIYRCLEVAKCESEYNSTKNIPYYSDVEEAYQLPQPTNGIPSYFSEQDNYPPTCPSSSLTSQIGTTVPNSVGLGTLFTFANLRAINNWKYNKVGIGLIVEGVYRRPNDTSYIFYNLGGRAEGTWAFAKNFLLDNTLIAERHPSDNTAQLIGYNLIYDMLAFKYNDWYWAPLENHFGIANIINTMYDKGVDNDLLLNNVTRWISDIPNKTTYYDYTFNASNILIGCTYSGSYGNFTTSAIGPETFEGIELVKAHQLVGWVDHDQHTYDAYAYYWDKDILQSGIFTEADLARFGLQLGLPVITSQEAYTHAKQNGSIDSILDMELAKDDLFYPIIANGKIDGENYLRGDQIPRESKLYKLGKEQDNHNLSDEDMPNVSDGTGTWEPTNPDENTYVEEIELNTPKVTPVGIFSRWYALTEYDVIDLFNFLYTADDSTISRIIQGLKLNGENPMDFFIGLRMFPFALNDFIDTMSSENIGFGNGVDSGVVAERITSASFVLDLGSCTFRKYFNNFLDYEPYTTAKLYIPFCGEVNVETALFVGHTISVKMIVDLTTGTCCAVIYRDGIPCMYQDGNIASEVQITGTNSTEYVNMAKSALGKVVSGTVETAIGASGFGQPNSANAQAIDLGRYNIATKKYEEGKHVLATEYSSQTSQTVGGSRMASGIAKYVEGVYEWHNMPTPLGVSGNSTALTELFKPQYCYFIIEQAVPIPISNYGNSYGYACLEYGKISALADGTLVAAKNVNITPPNATLPEISEIKELLESGVWK